MNKLKSKETKVNCYNCGPVQIPSSGIMYTSDDKAYIKCDICGECSIVFAGER